MRPAAFRLGLDPKVTEFLWKATPDIFDLAVRDLPGEQLEHRHDRLRRIGQGITPEYLAHILDKTVDTAKLLRRCGRTPLLIIRTSEKSWKLCAQVGCLINVKRITQRMQNGFQESVAASLIIPVEALIQIIDPNVRC